jgi:type IV pilus assembly protein PilE
MTVLAIVAILAAIAYPVYAQHVRRSKRIEAHALLSEAAHFMQRHYSANDRYTLLSDNSEDSTKRPQTDLLPPSLRNSPKTGPANYTLTVEASNQPPAYLLKATRAGGMSADPCGTLTLSSQGVRGIQDASPSLMADDCWK